MAIIELPERFLHDYSDFDPITLTIEEKHILSTLREHSDTTGFEFGAALGSAVQTGFFTSHASHYVDIPDDIFVCSDVCFYHAHTNVTPFSVKDMSLLLRENVKKVVVVTANRDVFCLYVGNGYRPDRDEFDATVDEIRSDVDFSIMDDPDFPEWSPEERVYVGIREQMYRIGRKFGWTIEGGAL